MAQEQSNLAQAFVNLLHVGQTWSADQMDAHQRLHLAQLLRHAQAQVPFYKTRLDTALVADGGVDWNAWRELPILTRQEVQQAGELLYAQHLPNHCGPVNTFRTSGSSGRPIAVRISHLHTLANRASNKRFLLNAGIRSDFKFAYTRDVFLDGTAITTDFAYWNPRTGVGSGALFVNRRLPIPQRLDVLAEHGVDVLVDFPTAIELLAHHNIKRAKPLTIPHVLGYGMGFNEAGRALIEHSFSARVSSSYACKEAGALAEQCVSTGNYHVNTELVLMEPDPAQQGVLITPFFQLAQPFIRYRLDDVVEFAPACACGHKHQTIIRISGKADPIFHFPGGVAIVPFEPQLNKTAIYQWASAMQISQTADADLVVRYVATSEAEPAMKAELAEFVHRTWHSGIRIDFQRVDDLPRNAGGKQQRFVREMPAPTA